MLTARGVPAVAILQVVLLTALGVLLRWGVPGWVAASVSLAVVDVAAARLARSYRVVALGPADVVTLTRVALACGVLAVVAEHWAERAPGAPAPVSAVAVLGAVALALDGWTAGWPGPPGPGPRSAGASTVRPTPSSCWC